MATREQIYEALFALTFQLNGIQTRSRKLKIYSDVTSAECPAIYQNQTGESVSQKINQPRITTMKCDWYLYLNDKGDRQTPPSTRINDFMTSIDKLFLPDAGLATFTLGGLVQHCFINGEVRIVEGVLGDYSIAIIPINILIAEEV